MPPRHVVDLVARVMKFRVGDRPRRAAHIVAIHSQHKTDEAARGRESPLNVWPLLRQRRTINFHKADVLRTGCETQPPQPGGVERLGYFFRRRSLPVRCDRGMLFE